MEGRLFSNRAANWRKIMKGKILIVDDEEALRKSLAEILQLEGYDVVATDTGESALNLLVREEVDLILLDLKMPGMDGMEVFENVNRLAPETRVILLTAHGSLESAIEALRLGAHDYILKPASTRTILNSIARGLARRTEQQHKRMLLEQLDASIQRLKDMEGMDAAPANEQSLLSLDDGVMMDFGRREIWRGNQKITLTPTEAKLMKILLENRGRVLTHRELVFLVQGYETSDWEAPEVLRPLVSRLRRKLSAFPGGEKWIVNVRGTGYVFEWQGGEDEDTKAV
jgi:DNA-binding response OmpR family regulator